MRGIVGLSLTGMLLAGCGGAPSGGAGSPPRAEEPASGQAAAHTGKEPPASPGPSRKVGEPTGLRSATLQSSRGVPWKLKAHQIAWSQGSRVARGVQVEFTMYPEDKTRRTYLEAAGADVNVDTERVDFEGRVRVDGPRGEQLLVNRLVWDGQLKQFHGDQGVRLVRGNSVIEGDDVVASPDLKVFQITGNVRGSMGLDEGGT